MAAALAGAGLLAAVPAAQARDAAAATCAPQPAAAHPFATWDDFGLYTLIAGGDMESGLDGWTTTGTAHAIEDNEPFQVGGVSDRQALALSAGDSATTAPICIDDTYPWFRFFARNTSGRKGSLKIVVLYTDSRGRARSEETDGYATSDAEWRPSDTIGIPVDFRHAGDAVVVSFRFTAQAGSSFVLDDVYVDPMARG